MSTHTLPHSCVPSACPGGSPSGVAPGPYRFMKTVQVNHFGRIFSNVQCTNYKVYFTFYRMRLCDWACTFNDVITCTIIACQSCNTHSCLVQHGYGQACNKNSVRKMKVVQRESENWTWYLRRQLILPTSNPSVREGSTQQLSRVLKTTYDCWQRPCVLQMAQSHHSLLPWHNPITHFYPDTTSKRVLNLQNTRIPVCIACVVCAKLHACILEKKCVASLRFMQTNWTILHTMYIHCFVGNRHVMIGHKHMEAISTTK